MNVARHIWTPRIREEKARGRKHRIDPNAKDREQEMLEIVDELLEAKDEATFVEMLVQRRS